MIPISEARPSLVFIKCAWLCVQAPQLSLSQHQGRDPGFLQAPQLCATPWPMNGVMLPLQALQALISGLPVSIRQGSPILSHCVLVSHRNLKVLSHPTCVSLYIPKLWLAAWTQRRLCTPLDDCLHPHPLDLPLSMLKKQLTYHILYTFIYMHFSLTLYSEILPLRILQNTQGLTWRNG